LTSILSTDASSSFRRRLGKLVGDNSDGASFSSDRSYRHLLWRSWALDGPILFFVGLNPSTVDERLNDPTIRRCISFARSSDARGLLIGNLFAYRATKPRDLFTADEPVGKENDFWLAGAAQTASKVVACWGVHGSYRHRAQDVSRWLPEAECLGLTMAGHPRHPLYVRSDTHFRPYQFGP
jgi:hypothetical protein